MINKDAKITISSYPYNYLIVEDLFEEGAAFGLAAAFNELIRAGRPVGNSDILSFFQDVIPLVPDALGNRIPLTGPYHVDGATTAALSAIALATFPNVLSLLSLAMALPGINGMIGSHFMVSCLYGILVTENGNVVIVEDLLGYSGVSGSGY